MTTRDPEDMLSDVDVLNDVYEERRAQDEKFGQQNLSDGTGGETFAMMRDHAQQRCQEAHQAGTVTWEHVATEEYFEALAETDPAKLSIELVQLAAVLVAWVGAIDRRRG